MAWQRTLILRWRRLQRCVLLTGLFISLIPQLAQAVDSIQSVDASGFVGQYNSLALDNQGFPVISYFDNTNGDLKLVHCNDPNCTGGNESIVVVDANGAVGRDTSLVLDRNGFPVISYFDETNDALKLVHCNDPNCADNNDSIQVVDSGGFFITTQSSLQLDSQGFPVISYSTLLPGDLRLAHCNDPNCAGGNESIQLVAFEHVRSTSLALDSRDFPVISYRGSDNNDLKLVHCNDPNCTGGNESIVVIDTTRFAGAPNSLVLDRNGFPVISYYEGANGDLKLIHCNDPNCTGGNESTVAIDTIGNVGFDSSLILDRNGFPVISYLDGSKDKLKLAHCNDPNCTGNDENIVEMDTIKFVLFNTSLKLDSRGFPVISYLGGNTDLKLAHCDDENCAPLPPQVCGNSVIEGAEQCDVGDLNGQSGVCCTNTCTFVPVNTTCRDSAGVCDVAEVCSGVSDQCPADGFASAQTECRSATGTCDGAEFCTGSGASCPENTFADVGTACGGSRAACDALDTCDGGGNCVDRLDPVGTVCASANGLCDPADICDGVNKTCPVTVASAGTPCGGSDAECDALDTCNGSGGCVDHVDPTGTVCRPGVDSCDLTEACTGNSKSCPVDVGMAATTGCTVNGIPNQPCQGDGSDDLILGTSGNDVIRGGAGGDTLKGNAGDDLLCGEEGDDTLLGAHGADTLLGGPGEDVLKGEADNDTLDGGSEDDTLIGGMGTDALDGGPSNDKLLGNEDADVLLGDAGNDILNGGDGNDILDGEANTDDLTGGPGSDTCLNGEKLTTCE